MQGEYHFSRPATTSLSSTFNELLVGLDVLTALQKFQYYHKAAPRITSNQMPVKLNDILRVPDLTEKLAVSSYLYEKRLSALKVYK
jgi:hypothetical protein